MRVLVFSVVLLALLCMHIHAVDYSKIERVLRKEPTYQNAPMYALLLFGKQANLRVWAVLDGQSIYIDRNGDGEFTGKGERFARLEDCRDVEIRDPDGKTRYIVKGVNTHDLKDSPRKLMMVSVDIKGPLSYSQYCGVELRTQRQEAKIAHFHGPLTMGPVTVNGKLRADLSLVTGGEPTDLQGHVGTLNDEHGCWVVAESHHGNDSAFPKGVFPVVDVEFPPKVLGGASVKKQYMLDKFC